MLFLSTKPLSSKKIAALLKASLDDVKKELGALKDEWHGRGITLFKNTEEYQLMSSPDNATIAEQLLKEEFEGELTRPQLETLTIVAYRGPLTRAELEEIRGVNCSIILRNLLMRGLIETATKEGDANPRYQVTIELLRYLGLPTVEELPDYETLHKNTRPDQDT